MANQIPGAVLSFTGVVSLYWRAVASAAAEISFYKKRGTISNLGLWVRQEEKEDRDLMLIL